MSESLTREPILAAIRAALEPQPFVHAMWEGGAAGFGRIDQWSDIDLQVDADDDRVTDVFPLVEAAIAPLSPISLRYEIPQPAWHGHHQVFYRLKNASPYLLLDFVVIRRSNPDKMIQPEMHGSPAVHFDKVGATRWTPLDRAALTAKLDDRKHSLLVSFELFQILTEKELHRKNWAEAMSFYHAFTLRPLVELLRIRHCPERHGFYVRYYKHDLPLEVSARLEPLFFVQSPDDLAKKRAEAETWFRSLMA
ncbi:MAG: nucleotidyltransferase domain-containing protein [Candidatus Eisenbacteria bacterium]|nr:nucleotidyltransferase domain-containing protein [Candidatus Eisenbacteria bacterium]